ncbi:MARVEL domain-containing protein 2-like [Xiphophorus couchianus]|uniref:MARVEL domain-containing protein 2-like n=1 Tax=Xiphophorus couchianus TaxID=32473 RepID=UPI001016C4CE|nr:MARVEL domain-containing protein 2-like [Xiphophorus couchianus]XP_027875272.1 MARVEL domain-containing protein 2-like [Xiphophorus couchianus]
MRNWSVIFKGQEHRGEDGSSSHNKTPTTPAVPMWVTHTPPPNHVKDDSDEDSMSMSHTSSSPCDAENSKRSMKSKLRSIIPKSLGGIINKRAGESDSETTRTGIQILPNGTRVSPPVSPFLERRNWDESSGNSTKDSKKSLLRQTTPECFCQSLQEESLLTSIHPAEYYAAKVEVYQQKYSYLKSWPGLLRLLAGLQLLFGGMVSACVVAYIQKDSEWFNTYGLYSGINNNGLGLSGYSYTGPMTAFILSVAGISWMITLSLLVTGMTMYYRTILLDSSWWPLTEAFINLALFLLYMAAGIVYINDLNRGGLCHMTIGVNPIMANLCRVDGGQMAGTAFIFINMIMYLGSFLVCLKMWRHEAVRKVRHNADQKGEFNQSISLNTQRTKQISFRDEPDKPLNKDSNCQPELPANVQKSSVSPNRATVSNHTPKVHVIADYIIKYPEIRSEEEREKYKAVFNDQYLEYKDLHRNIITTLNKFRELDTMVNQLPRKGKSWEDQQRIQNILKIYQDKKNDPAFLEKKERCDYLKAKLRHIKNKILDYDQETADNHWT